MGRLEDIANQINLGKYQYDVECIACICSCCASESEDGMFYHVYLSADDDSDEELPYANHTIRVGEDILVCKEYIDSKRKWYFNDNEIDSSLLTDFQNIIEPFDFEEYAIDNFDGDAISESIPYGDPYCLIIDGCVFMIEKGGDKFSVEDVRDLLQSYNWSKERIENSINDGFEVTSDVWNAMCDLPIVYANDKE